VTFELKKMRIILIVSFILGPLLATQVQGFNNGDKIPIN